MFKKLLNKIRTWYFWFNVNDRKLKICLLPEEIEIILNKVERSYKRKDGKTYLLTSEGFEIELVPSKEIWLENEKCHQRVPINNN